jgi:hypothetical protein
MVTIVNSQVYDLGAVGNSEYLERLSSLNSDATLSIELELQNTPQGVLIQHTYTLTLLLRSAIALTLKAVDGTTGSTTTFKHLMMVVPLLTRRYLLLTDI